MLLVSLPRSERAPPLVFRLTTGGRRLRSAALLSALLSAPARGSAAKVKQLRQEAFHPPAQRPHGRIAAQVRLTDGPQPLPAALLPLYPPGPLHRFGQVGTRSGVGLSMVVHLTHRVGPSGWD